MRTKADQTVVAQALAGLGKSQGSLISVLATPGFKLPKNPTLAAFSCKGCDTRFAAHRGSQPFCVTCGCVDVEPMETSADAPETLTEDQELSAVLCPSCHTTNIVSNEVLSKLGGAMHCITCGGDLVFDDAEAPDGADRGESVDPEVEDLNAGGDDFTSDTELPNDGDTEQAADTNQINTGNGSGQEDLDPPVGVENENQSTLPLLDPNDPTVDVQMDEINPDDVNPDDVDVIQTSSTAYAMLHGVPVATLSIESAGANAEIFGKPSFIRAVKAAVERNGVKAGLKEMGFSVIIAKFPLKKLVDAQVESRMAEEKAKVEAAVKEVNDDMHQSLLIAMAGLQKNFFRGHTHPLKAALFDELVAAGVKHADKVVDRVFKAHGNSYLTTLLAVAMDLRGKPVEARNALAEAVDTANYLDAETQEDDEASEEESQDSIPGEEASVARLHTHSGLRITQPAETASVTDQSLSRNVLFPKGHGGMFGSR